MGLSNLVGTAIPVILGLIVLFVGLSMDNSWVSSLGGGIVFGAVLIGAKNFVSDL